jgi:adenine phosphoribosyltransferase
VDLKSLVRTVPNYPKEGIMFRDITTLLKDPKGFSYTIDLLKDHYIDHDFETIVGIESRGFIVGAALAFALNKGFVPIRKVGKLPGDVIQQHYNLEYGTDTIEIHKDALSENQKVLLVDDLLATGGTALGSISLIEKLGARIHELCFIIDLPELGGGQKLRDLGHNVHCLLDFEGH